MLNAVPSAINHITRAVVLNHPNAWSVEVYRKTVERQALGHIAGNPTMGGLAVLDSADEEDYRYDFLGYGHALQAEQFQPAPMHRRGDANIGASDEFRFLLEPDAEFGEQWFFEPKSHDVFYLVIGPARMAYEIVGTESTGNIPPYSTRYICNRRDDLDASAPEPPTAADPPTI